MRLSVFQQYSLSNKDGNCHFFVIIVYYYHGTRKEAAKMGSNSDWINKANYTVYHPGQKTGHYESYFLRANHPSKPLAFWIRYTIFSPEGHPENAIGELWAVYFDGEKGINIAVKKEVPFGQCSFSSSALEIQIGDSNLNAFKLSGEASANQHVVKWEMNYSGNSEPLFLLPLKMYSGQFPKAKSIVPLPLCRFNGKLTVDGDTISVENWVGSQNHNWGSKHTDLYAWGQVAGFDNSPDSFLEVATARLKVGPLLTPAMTPIVLRHRGQEFCLNTLTQTILAHGHFSCFDWHFGSEDDTAGIAGRIWADSSRFVGLKYYNPPVGNKYCLNTKLASCNLRITYKSGARKGSSEFLTTLSRAAFEILTDKSDHGIEIQV
jgi:hypothetical protein